MRPGGVVLGVLMLCASARHGSAQDAISSMYRDSLAAITSADSITRVEQNAVRMARAERGDRSLELRLAFARLRMAEILGNPDDYGRAIGDFESITEAAPGMVGAWLGRGMALLGYGEAVSRVTAAVNNLLTRSPAEQAGEAFARGTAADTTVTMLHFVVDEAVQHLGDGWRIAALAAARATVAMPTERRAAWLVERARIERTAGSLDSALVAVDAAARLTDDPLVRLQFAHTHLAAGRLDGAPAWYDGLTRAHPEALAQYRRDLVLVLPDSMLSAFDRATGEERSDLMRRYWNAQDSSGLPLHAERLRDHYRRLDFARREFALPTGYTLSSGFDDHIDDRGRTHILHGPPTDRAVLSGIIGVPPSESWHYARPNQQPLLFHFLAAGESAPLMRVESILDILAASNQARWFSGRFDATGRDTASTPVNTYGGELSAIIAQQILLSRWNVGDVYRRMLARGKGGAESMQAEERGIGRASIAAAASWGFRYELPLDARISVLALAPDRGSPNIQLAYAIAGRSLSPVRTSRGYAYEVRVRATVRSGDGSELASLDTVRVFVTSQPIPGGAHLLGRHTIAVPPGTMLVRAAVENDGRGVMVTRDSVRVSASPGIDISDIALGSRNVRLAIPTAGGDSAWVNPLRSFRAGEPVLLYFEVSGLGQGDPYRSDLRVARKAGGGALGMGSAAMLTLGFDQVHPGGLDRIQRELDVGRLRPGEYVIEVAVSTSGQRAVRRQEFTIVK